MFVFSQKQNAVRSVISAQVQVALSRSNQLRAANRRRFERIPGRADAQLVSSRRENDHHVRGDHLLVQTAAAQRARAHLQRWWCQQGSLEQDSFRFHQSHLAAFQESKDAQVSS